SGVVTRLTLPPIRGRITGRKNVKIQAVFVRFQELRRLDCANRVLINTIPVARKSHGFGSYAAGRAFRWSRPLRAIVLRAAGDVAAIRSPTKASLATAAGPSTNG